MSNDFGPITRIANFLENLGYHIEYDSATQIYVVNGFSMTDHTENLMCAQVRDCIPKSSKRNIRLAIVLLGEKNKTAA